MSLPDHFAPLQHLPLLAEGSEQYARALMSAGSNDVLRVGGALLLIRERLVRLSDVDELLGLAGFGAVRDRAYDYFEAYLERAVAARFLDVASTYTRDGVATDLRRARAANDPVETGALLTRRYLTEGNATDLRAAAEQADMYGGWQAAAGRAALAVAVAPTDLSSSAQLAGILDAANQQDLLQEFLRLLQPVAHQRPLRAIYSASLKVSQGDPGEGLKLIEAAEQEGRSGPVRYALGPIGEQVRARALHRLGRYADAHRGFKAMNEADARSAPPAALATIEKQTNTASFPALPPASRPDVVMMLGFPRSGTTLLENALAAHPRIETLEELPSLRAAMSYIERGNEGRTPEAPGTAELAISARDRYFAEVAWSRGRRDADVVVDKFPIRSIFAPFMQRLIPDQKYIFSIRHPYDVAISAFQQRFRSNAAMSSFYDFKATAELYDLTMTRWFSVHSMDSSRVHYVRYDQLVEQFDQTVSGALTFVGLEWDNAVTDFAEQARSRAGRTPSYQKVRQGISLGVQTYWRNYDFLFRDRPEAASLTKWAKFFGYETI
jgi:hypothetical protein